MGELVDGRWIDDYDAVKNGAPEKPSNLKPSNLLSQNISTAKVAILQEVPGRFLLIGSMSCPWSHRTFILHSLKGLLEHIPIQIAGGRRDQGYSVNHNLPWELPGAGRKILHVHEIYTTSNPEFSGRASVPVLWDSLEGKIISNGSMAICQAFDEMVAPNGNLNFTVRPNALRQDIDALNARIYDLLAKGVYRAGLAQSQKIYDHAVNDVFNMMDELEVILSTQRFLFGNLFTLSDVVLFPVLARFDAVYNTHFRCTQNRLMDFPSLWGYAKDIYKWRGMEDLIDFDVIRRGYFLNDGQHNPFGIISARPHADWCEGHNRDEFGWPQVMLISGQVCKIFPETITPVES